METAMRQVLMRQNTMEFAAENWVLYTNREKVWKKLQKGVAKCSGMWYYTWAPSAETKEWLLKSEHEAFEKNQ